MEQSFGRVIRSLCVRIFLYAVLLGLIAYGTLWGAVQFGAPFFDETGPVEILQTVFALITMMVFLLVGRRIRSSASFVVVLSIALFCCVIRESDYFLDVFVFRHAWEVGVGGCLVFLIGYILRNREELMRATLEHTQKPSFGILMSGVLVLVVF